jgi:plasmid maintenance system antidote protein VapI
MATKPISPAETLQAAIAKEGCTALATRAGVSTSAIYTLIRQNRWPRQIRVKTALGNALGVVVP